DGYRGVAERRGELGGVHDQVLAHGVSLRRFLKLTAAPAPARPARPRKPAPGTSSVVIVRRSGHRRLIIWLEGSAHESSHSSSGRAWKRSTLSSCRRTPGE